MAFEDTINYFDNSLNSEKLKKVSCYWPFTSFHIFPDGSVSNCCFYWMPTIIGNITKKHLREIMQDQRSLDAKKSVSDGTYKFCNGEICPSMINFVTNNKIEHPLMPIEDVRTLDEKKIILILDYDKSCNLYCGSCRNERILFNSENAPNELKTVHEKLITQLYDLLANDYQIALQVTSSGDPFASYFYWNFLKNIKSNENFKVRLTTNGTLMNRERLLLPYAQKIEHIEVSVDAYSVETYTKIRRGGNFNALKANLMNLNEMIHNNELPLLKNWKINFVVQADNFHEMIDFAKWALQFSKLGKIWYLLIYDWGHLKKDEFKSKAIWHEDHPQYHEFLTVLKDPIFDNEKILIGNLAGLRKKALAL